MIDWSKYPSFTEDEFRCKGSHCCSGQAHMDPEFMDRLQELRNRCGFPFVITSGFRCPDHNAIVSSTGRHGPHTTGKACDIAVNGQKRFAILREFHGLGFKGIGIARSFIHLDILANGENSAPRPTSWTYG